MPSLNSELRRMPLAPALAVLLVAPVVCHAGGIHLPPPPGTTIAVRPCTSAENPSLTNAIPFQESFENYTNNAPIEGAHGWHITPNDISSVTNAALPGAIVTFPIATNHTRYASLNTQGDDLINVIKGSQQHVWVDMLTTFVPNDTSPYTNGTSPQLVLYSNHRSNLCAIARTPNTNTASVVESSRLTDSGYPGPGVFYRLTIQLAYLPPPTGGCFAVYMNGVAVNWPGGEALPGVAGSGGQGPWLRCLPGAANAFPGLAFTGTGFLDDLVVTARDPLPNTPFTASIAGVGALRWPGDFGRNYQVDACTNLMKHDWQPLGAPVVGSGTTNLFTDPTNGLSTRFYRIRALDP